MTRAIYYPPANRTAQWYADNYPGVTMVVNKLCLHTTEGSGWPAYSGGAMAPNMTGFPDMTARKINWRQHFPANMSSRALAHPSGTPATNTAGTFQVELIGTCERGGPGLFWPDAPDWALQDVGDVLAWLHIEWPVPLRAASTWLSYPASYGNSSARMSWSTWGGFTGMHGHQHVPGNDHGDPGSIDANKIVRMATTGDSDVVTEADIDAIAERTRDKIMEHFPAGGDLNVKTILARMWPQLMEITKRLTDLAKAVGVADANDVLDVDVLGDAIATKVIAALPKTGTGTGGSLTRDDVEAAVKQAFREGTSSTT
jgi:hypothetical protein